MSNPLPAQSKKTGTASSIGIVFCILGLLAGIFLMIFGGETFSSAASNDADIRGPLGILIGFGGILVFLVLTVGLIALVRSRSAKSRTARGVMKVVGAAAALIIVGAVLLILVFFIILVKLL